MDFRFMERPSASRALTGVQDISVLRRIARDFDGTFALNAWAARPGSIRVGDPVRLWHEFDGAEAPRLGRLASG